MAQVDVVLIGGGEINDPGLRSIVDVNCKSLIELHGKPMIQWVVEGLKAADCIGRVVVVGPEILQSMEVAQLADMVLTEADHEVANLEKGMDAMPDSERLLLMTGDMPLITPEAVDDLMTHSPIADIVYPTVRKQDILDEFPNRKWVFVRARDGEFTGSSAVIFRPQTFRYHRDTLKKVFDSRRSVMDLVRLWGAGFALKFALGQLSLYDVERRISEVLNVDGRAYISHYPELAFDVDHAADIALAEEKLKSRNPP